MSDVQCFTPGLIFFQTDLFDDFRRCVQAKTLLKGKLFGEYESKLAANHKQVMKTFKSKYTTAKKSDLKSLFFKEDSSSTPVCELTIPRSWLGGDQITSAELRLAV